jgi:hypothetical protein
MTLSPDKTARFWGLRGGRERSRVALPEHVPGGVASPDGRTVATWSFHNEELDKGVQFWDTASGKPAEGWTAPAVKRVGGVRFTPDGKAVLVCTDAGVLVWEPRAGKLLRTLPGRGAYDFAFSPDGRTVAALRVSRMDHARGTLLHVWDLTTGAPHPANDAAQGHLDEVDGVAFSHDGRLLASCCGAERSVRVWEARTGRPLRSFAAEGLSPRALAFSPDGKYLFAGTSAAVLRWEVATGREAGRYPASEEGEGRRYHLLFAHLTDDGRTLLALSQLLGRGERGCALHAWDAGTGKRLRCETLTEDDLWSAYSRFSGDGRLLVMPHGSVRDTATGRELCRLSVEGKYSGTPVAFSADAALVAAGVWQEIKRPGVHGREMVGVQVWELATLLPLARLETGELADFAFTPDGRGLVTAGPDALKLWDLASGREVARRPTPGRFRGSYGASFASVLAVAADGHTVATGQPDTAVLLWDLLAPARPAAPLSAAELEACWADLAGADGGRAMAALSRLADAPGQAVPLLRDRLRPARAPGPAELRRLLRDLDDADFARREAATQRLTELGELAEGALREALRGKASPEVRRRAEALLAGPRRVRSAEARRHLRAVRVLEGVGSPEARRVLEGLSRGAAEARLTKEAQAALRRLARRSPAAP